MEKNSSMMDSDGLVDARMDILANAAKIIMKTRESIAHLNGASSGRRAKKAVSSPESALPAHAHSRHAMRSQCAYC